MHPGRQQGRGTPQRQVLRRTAHQQLAGAVEVQPGVPVGVLHPRHPHDERRVGHDLVEAPPSDGAEPRTRQQLHVHAVQRERCRSQGQCTLAEVGGRHVLGVAGDVHRLHSAPRTQVERRGHRRGRDGAQQRQRRLAHPEYVLPFDPVFAQLTVEVAHQPARARAGVQRSHVQGGAYTLTHPLQQPGAHRVVDVHRCQRAGHLCGRAPHGQQEQPHQCAQLTAPPAGAFRGHRLPPAQRGVRVGAEQPQHAVGVVTGPQETAAQRTREGQ